jgi:hypothetical protein
MRFALRTLICTSLVVVSTSAMGAESGSKWWPFGGKETVVVPPPANEASAITPLPDSQPVIPTPSPSLSTGPIEQEVLKPADPATSSSKSGWLGLHMPKWAASNTAQKPTPPPRNAWAEPPLKAPSSPVQSMKNGAHKVAAGTKSAYHKTVAALTPGSKSKPAAAKPPQVARRDVQPPLWKRMFGAKEPELQQPQTVPQWMAQKRLDP